MKPYLDACIASRVHFQFFHPLEMARQGHFMNDCIYRAMNHAKWLATSMDGWVSGDPGWSEVFRWGPHLERARQGLKLCQIHQQKIVSFPFGESQLSANYFTIKIAVARVYLDVRFLGFTSFWVRPSLVSWKKNWRTKLPVLKFQVFVLHEHVPTPLRFHLITGFPVKERRSSS